MMIVDLILGATVGVPIGAVVSGMLVSGKVQNLADNADRWRGRFNNAVRDIADMCAERDRLRHQVEAMQPMHDLGVRRARTVEKQNASRKEARRAAREGAQA